MDQKRSRNVIENKQVDKYNRDAINELRQVRSGLDRENEDYAD
jgi:hypothetical protein